MLPSRLDSSDAAGEAAWGSADGPRGIQRPSIVVLDGHEERRSKLWDVDQLVQNSLPTWVPFNPFVVIPDSFWVLNATQATPACCAHDLPYASTRALEYHACRLVGVDGGQDTINYHEC